MTAQTLAPDPPRRLAVITRLYVWSIVFEGLLFFIIGNQFATGFNITIGKLLQIAVMVLLVLAQFASGRDIRFVNPTSPAYKYFAAFFVLAVASGIMGALTGAYRLNAEYGSAYATTAAARLIRGPSTRPFIEYAILVYYFIYFTVLPRYLLRTDEAKSYFFRAFKFAFIICLIVGVIDLIGVSFGHYWVPRDMSERRHAGFRFHGLAGEPRDAFVYLMFGLAILNLYAYWQKGGKVSREWVVIVFVAAMFTQSASGILGLLFGLLLVVAASLKEFTVRHVLWLSVTMVFIFAVVTISVRSSPRLQAYHRGAFLVFGTLERGVAPPPLISQQMVNIFPLWDLYSKISHGNIVPLLIGSGLGSASVINNNLGGTRELVNPNSEVIRLLYECGIVGTILLILAFIYPVRIVTEPYSAVLRRRFLIFTCLLLGLFLAHRSTAAFIYLGLFLAVLGRPAPPLKRAQESSARRLEG